MDAPSAGRAALAAIEADAAAIVAAVEAGAPPASTPEVTLSQVQRALLDFERRWWQRSGAKEQAIRDHFEISPTRYYQALNALIDLPQAARYDPTLVHRLLRLRTSSPRGRRLT